MNSSLASKVGKLTVDWNHGLIIRADDQVEVTQVYLDAHPFIKKVQRNEIGDVDYYVGPSARVAAYLAGNGKPVAGLNVIKYFQTASVAGLITLQKEAIL